MSESRECPRFEASRAGRSHLLRALDNKEDGVSSAFPRSNKNGIFLINLYLIYRRVMKMQVDLSSMRGSYEFYSLCFYLVFVFLLQ